MKRLAWLTDIHLNFLTNDAIESFLETVNAHDSDGVLISGDLTDSLYLHRMLQRMSACIHKPVYFVCGNHDFYYDSIANIRKSIPVWLEVLPNITWLNSQGVVELSPKTALIGHDGWADGRYGNYHTSPLILNDFFLIEEFKGLLTAPRLAVMQSLAQQTADHFSEQMPRALDKYEHLLVVTHVPPFEEVCWNHGKPSDDAGLPHFASRVVGDTLLEMATRYPHRKITVLCGHTHNPVDQFIRPNLHVLVGHSEYEAPEIQGYVVEVR